MSVRAQVVGYHYTAVEQAATEPDPEEFQRLLQLEIDEFIKSHRVLLDDEVSARTSRTPRAVSTDCPTPGRRAPL